MGPNVTGLSECCVHQQHNTNCNDNKARSSRPGQADDVLLVELVLMLHKLTSTSHAAWSK
jgi:hypothetical protein